MSMVTTLTLWCLATWELTKNIAETDMAYDDSKKCGLKTDHSAWMAQNHAPPRAGVVPEVGQIWQKNNGGTYTVVSVNADEVQIVGAHGGYFTKTRNLLRNYSFVGNTNQPPKIETTSAPREGQVWRGRNRTNATNRIILRSVHKDTYAADSLTTFKRTIGRVSSLRMNYILESEPIVDSPNPEDFVCDQDEGSSKVMRVSVGIDVIKQWMLVPYSKRRVKQHKVAKFLSRMERGVWSWPIMEIKLGPDNEVGDGNNRLSAAIQYAAKHPGIELMLTVTKFDSMVEFESAVARIDESDRSLEDVLETRRICTPGNGKKWAGAIAAMQLIDKAISVVPDRDEHMKVAHDRAFGLTSVQSLIGIPDHALGALALAANSDRTTKRFIDAVASNDKSNPAARAFIFKALPRMALSSNRKQKRRDMFVTLTLCAKFSELEKRMTRARTELRDLAIIDSVNTQAVRRYFGKDGHHEIPTAKDASR